jgi:hypothetical protein
LRVNAEKSAVAPALERVLLGFRFFRDRSGRVRVTVDPKALKRAQDRRSAGRNGSAPRRATGVCALGLPERDCREVAASQKGYWPLAHSPQLQRALRNAYWHKTMDLKGFLDPYRRFRAC